MAFVLFLEAAFADGFRAVEADHRQNLIRVVPTVARFPCRVLLFVSGGRSPLPRSSLLLLLECVLSLARRFQPILELRDPEVVAEPVDAIGRKFRLFPARRARERLARFPDLPPGGLGQHGTGDVGETVTQRVEALLVEGEDSVVCHGSESLGSLLQLLHPAIVGSAAVEVGVSLETRVTEGVQTGQHPRLREAIQADVTLHPVQGGCVAVLAGVFGCHFLDCFVVVSV